MIASRGRLPLHLILQVERGAGRAQRDVGVEIALHLDQIGVTRQVVARRVELDPLRDVVGYLLASQLRTPHKAMRLVETLVATISECCDRVAE